MADTIRKQIIAALADGLEGITKADGYQTDIGAGTVAKGRAWFTTAELPGVGVLPGVEEGKKKFGFLENDLPIVIAVAIPVGTSNPSDLAEDVLGDLILNVLGEDRTFGGLASSIDYEGGGVDEFPDRGEQTVNVMARFRIKYSVNLGDPFTQP